MAFVTFSPPRNPDYGLDEEETPRVLIANFGGGYTQRAGDGINTTPSKMNVTFSALDESDKDDVVEFYRAQAGYIPFYYTLPDQVTAKKWIAKTWSTVRTNPGTYRVTSQWEEVFDIDA